MVFVSPSMQLILLCVKEKTSLVSFSKMLTLRVDPFLSLIKHIDVAGTFNYLT